MPYPKLSLREDLHSEHFLDNLHQILSLQVVVEGGGDCRRLFWSISSADQCDNVQDDFAGDVFGGVAAEWH